MIQMWLKREQFLRNIYFSKQEHCFVFFSEASVTIYLQWWAMFNLERERLSVSLASNLWDSGRQASCLSWGLVIESWSPGMPQHVWAALFNSIGILPGKLLSFFVQINIVWTWYFLTWKHGTFLLHPPWFFLALYKLIQRNICGKCVHVSGDWNIVANCTWYINEDQRAYG